MSGRAKLLISGALIAAAVTYAVISSTTGSTVSYFLTVEELLALDRPPTNRTITVSGAVLGDSIRVDPSVPRVTFAIVHVPSDPDSNRGAGSREEVHDSTMEEATALQLNVVYDDLRPPSLQGEAQAIIRGKMRADGTLHADEVLFKCPTRYEGAVSNEAH